MMVGKVCGVPGVGFQSEVDDLEVEVDPWGDDLLQEAAWQPSREP